VVIFLIVIIVKPSIPSKPGVCFPNPGKDLLWNGISKVNSFKLLGSDVIKRRGNLPAFKERKEI